MLWDNNTYLLVAVLGLVAINVVVGFLNLMSTRRSLRLITSCVDYRYEERQPLAVEGRDKVLQERIYEFEQEVLRLQKEQRKLAEELEKMRAVQQKMEHMEQERERIVEGLQSIHQVLLDRLRMRSSVPTPLRWRGWT